MSAKLEREMLLTGVVSPPVVECDASTSLLHEVSWRSFYEENFDALYRLIFSLGVPGSEIEDVIQRVFIVACRQINAGQEIVYPKAYLRGIAIRIVREHRRWYRVRELKRWLLDATEDAARPAPPTPEATTERAEIQQQVHQILAQLRPRHREVLVLTELEECPLQEVAHLLDIPVNTVRSRRYHALRAFEVHWRAQQQLEKETRDG